MVAAVRDPVAAGSRIVTVRGDDWFHSCGEVYLFLDLAGCQHSSARRVDPEHDSLDGGVGPYFGDDACETVSADVVRIVLLQDIPVGVDDCDLLLCGQVRRGFSGCIVAERYEFHILVTAFARKVGEFFLIFLNRKNAVGQIVIDHVFRKGDREVVDEIVE